MSDMRDFLQAEPRILHAYQRSAECLWDAYRHLPLPVAFRASGALQAWEDVFAAYPDLAPARAALADPNMARGESERLLCRGMVWGDHVRQIPGLARDNVRTVDGTQNLIALMLAFWLRRGALYEPTLPLGMLLGGSDVADDLPINQLKLPTPALCIAVPPQQRQHCLGLSAITIFEHEAEPRFQPAARRTLTLICSRPSQMGQALTYLVLLGSEKPATLGWALEDAAWQWTEENKIVQYEGTLPEFGAAGWKTILEYVVKVLLYLQLDQAVVREYRPYSTAPRVFPGLGKRKREARLAMVEHLYDRYIVGPESLAEVGLKVEDGQPGDGHQVHAHWRRGHFRMQPHGPQSSLRKPMFIAPMVVRADRLAGD